MLIHSIPPIYDSSSQILILGSFPSQASRKEQFFYSYPKNRFWTVLAAVFKDAHPKTIDDKKRFLLKHRIAVWDVIASCDIIGSSDASIKNVSPNNVTKILNTSNIKSIFLNDRAAHKLYNKYIEPEIGVHAIYLPSTSPANAVWTLNKLIAEWSILTKNTTDS